MCVGPASLYTCRASARRMVCTRCGIVGADARPNWTERPESLEGRPRGVISDPGNSGRESGHRGNDAIDPERLFAAVNCCIAKGACALDVGGLRRRETNESGAFIQP